MKDNYLFIPLTYIAIALFIFGVGWECRHLFNFSGGMFLGIAAGEWSVRRAEKKREENARRLEYEMRLEAIRAQYGYRNPLAPHQDEHPREGHDNILRPNPDSVLPQG